MDYPSLKLPAVRLRARKVGENTHVWDEIRGCWLVLTPEEWVRRHVLGYLTTEQEIPWTNIIQEHPVDVGGTAQRADIVVNDKRGRPLLLVECKASTVRITEEVLSQAVRYNKSLGCRYLMLTNGMDHYFYETLNGSDYNQMDRVPDLDLSGSRE